MTAIDAGRIARARDLLASHFPRTPLVPAPSFDGPGRSAYLKNETVLPTGSFKVRGALVALSARLAEGTVSEVVAASTGNHGAAVAFVARLLGVPCRIFLPERSNPVKVDRVREYGAVLVETGNDLTAAIDAAASYVAESGAYFLHDASDPNVPAGTATIAAEILEQLPSVEAVFVPMGDTALIRGVASRLQAGKPSVQVVGVVAERAPAYYLSWKAGTVVETESADTSADGLAVRRPLLGNVRDIRALVNEVVTVSESEMLDAIRRLRVDEHIVAEPSGAASVAALVKDARSGGDVVAIVTGKNISPYIQNPVADPMRPSEPS